MSAHFDPDRQPAGTSRGGQFAPSKNPESGVDLGAVSTATRTFDVPDPSPSGERGKWYIEHASKPKPKSDGAVTVTVMSLGGEPSANTDVRARVAAYPTPEDIDDRLGRLADEGERVTILRAGTGMFGASTPIIQQGRVFRAQGGVLGFLPVGKRTKGLRLSGVLDVVENTKPSAVDDLNRRWYESTGLPATEPLTTEALRGASRENPIAVVWTHPGFDGGEGRTEGCVWYIDDYQEEDDIANGYCWCPSDSGLSSEHGSVYGKDILRTGALVNGGPRVNFSEMMSAPEGRRDAYSYMFGGGE